MATKKIKKDEFMFGTEAVTMKMTDKDTTFLNSKGNMLFKVDFPMAGAWSDRRVAKAMLTLHRDTVVKSMKVTLKPAKAVKKVPAKVKRHVSLER